MKRFSLHAIRKHTVKLIALGLCLVVLLALIVYALGYHGPRDFPNRMDVPTQENLIKNAYRLRGAPYDPWMGAHDDMGSKLGFVVCSDVPNIAYGLSGFSIREALRRDFQLHPEAYDASDGNTPRNPFFHRRARNLYAYFKANNLLLPATAKPSVGDLVFYRRTPKGIIAHVALVTKVTSNGYAVMESAPRTLFAREATHTSPVRRGWILAGIGHLAALNPSNPFHK